MFAYRPLTAIVDAYETGTANVGSEGSFSCREGDRLNGNYVEGIT